MSQTNGSPTSSGQPAIDAPHPPSSSNGALVPQNPEQTETALTARDSAALTFDEPVILRPSPWMPQFVVWSIMGVTSFAIAWACLTKVDEAVPAQGKLEPKGAVKEVQAPVGGVVRSIEVEEGERVNQGEVLIRFDQTTAQAQEGSLEQIRATLIAENRFYRSQIGLPEPQRTISTLRQPLTTIPENPFSEALNIATSAENLAQTARSPAEWEELVRQWDRASQLMAVVPSNHPQYELAQGKTREYQANSVYAEQAAQQTAQLEPVPSLLPVQLPPEMQLLAENRAALIAENQLYRAQLEGSFANLNAAQAERLQASQAEYNSRVAAAQLRVEQLQRQLSQVRVQLGSNDRILELNQGILDKITPLYREGGIAEVQYLRQEQEVETLQAEHDRLEEEELRLQLAIAEAEEELANTQAGSTDQVLTRQAENEKRIAEIDSQLSKVIVENEKRIQEIDSQLSQTRQTLLYQELRAPVSGTVFDLQPTSPGFVANTSEPILKIVPSDGLVARVFITNRDIGFVELENEVDVRIDSFPYSEFGDVKGHLVKIGSDALPPDEIYPFYRFPAEIELDQQNLIVNGKEIYLQSGMSVSVNIKTRKRRVITFLTDLFIRKIDSLRTSR